MGSQVVGLIAFSSVLMLASGLMSKRHKRNWLIGAVLVGILAAALIVGK